MERLRTPMPKGYSHKSSTRTVCENLIIRPRRNDWSWDPSRVIRKTPKVDISDLL